MANHLNHNESETYPAICKALASFLLNQPKPAKLSFKTIRQLIQKCVPKAPVSTDRMHSSNNIQTDVSYVMFSCDKDLVLSIIYPFTNCVPHTLFNKLFFSPLVFPRHESPKPNHRSYAIQIRDSLFPPGKRPGLSKEQV